MYAVSCWCVHLPRLETASRFEDFPLKVVSDRSADLLVEDDISSADFSSEDDIYVVLDEDMTCPDWLMDPDSITELSTS